MFCYIQLPDGSSLQRTEAVSRRVVQIVKETPGVTYVSEFAGLSLVNLGNIANASSFFVRLDPFDERAKKGLGANAIIRDLNARIAKANIQDAYIGVFGPRRWTGWAPWAGSSCRSRTAPIWATRPSRRRPRN
jgi:multidrug efflux pump